MNQSPLLLHIAPFSRYVSRAAIVDSTLLMKKAPGAPNIPQGPALFIPLRAPIVDVSLHVGVRSINGCPLLFFDVMTDGEYFCNVASAGDHEVMEALERWDETGVMPIWLQTTVGPCGMITKEFKLNEVYSRAFAMSSHEDYLGQLRELFNLMLEPGVIEDIVASRIGRHFGRVHVGFVATTSTLPALVPVD